MARSHSRSRRCSWLAAPLLAACSILPAHAAGPTTIAVTGSLEVVTPPLDKQFGEVAGVATNSKGHVFVFTRTGGDLTLGAARAFTHGGSRLYEFDADGKYLREIGVGLYGFLAAHTVRVDVQDNVWVVDEAAGMVIKFSPEGKVLMTLGRKPEAVPVPSMPAKHDDDGLGVPGDTFDGPADVAWDGQGNIFVADGTGNARIIKFAPDGTYLKAWGGRGSGQGQFSNLHTIATDAAGNVYVGDRGNKRIQVFDNDGTFLRQITGVGDPAAICITRGPRPYLYSSNSGSPTDMDNGEIYRLDLAGKILGRFGSAGRIAGQFSSVHEIDCRNPDALLVAELGNWRVQKLTFGR